MKPHSGDHRMGVFKVRGKDSIASSCFIKRFIISQCISGELGWVVAMHE